METIESSGGGGYATTLQTQPPHGFYRRLKALFCIRKHSKKGSISNSRKAAVAVAVSVLLMAGIGIAAPTTALAVANGDTKAQAVNGEVVTYTYYNGTWYANKLLNGDFQYPALTTYQALWGGVSNPWPFVYVNVDTGYDFVHKSVVTGFDPISYAWKSDEYQAWNPDGSSDYFAEVQADHLAGAPKTYNGCDGNLYSEVSCAVGNYSVYQDIATTPGSIYKWSINHSSAVQNYVAKLQVLIGPVSSQSAQTATRIGSAAHDSNGAPIYKDANNGMDPADINSASPQLEADDTNQIGYVSSTIETIGAGFQFYQDAYSSWETYTGTYMVPAGQNVTRFKFRSLDTAESRVQNQLDDVVFEEAYPLYFDANGGTGNLPMNDDRNGSTIVKDADGVYQNYYTKGEVVTLSTAETYDEDTNGWSRSELTRPGYVLAGWSAEPHDPYSSVQAAKDANVLLSTYTITASGSVEQGNKVYAVWVPDHATLDAGDVRVRKTETGIANTTSPTADFAYTITAASTTAKNASGTPMDITEMPLPQATKTGTTEVTTNTTATITDGGTTLDGFSTPTAVRDTMADTTGSPADGSYEVFGDITYTQPGDYVYTITETGTGAIAGGWEYNTPTTTYTLRVRVEKDLVTGGISITGKWLTLDGGTGVDLSGTTGATFNNARLASVSVVPSITKNVTVSNGTPTFPAAFEYTITPLGTTAEGLDAATMPTSTNARVTTSTPATLEDQIVAFGAITFTKPGTYYYAINETAPTGGWSNVSGATTLTVVVKDVNGKLTADVSTSTATATADGEVAPTATIMATTFKNTYSAQDVTIDKPFTAVQKTITGDTTAVSNDFYFQLKANDAASASYMPAGSTGNVKYISANAPTGTASGAVISNDDTAFGSITYDRAGTYTYTITEVADANGATLTDGAGWTYDKTIHTVAVTVVDNNGVLEASVTLDGTAMTSAAAFTNVFKYTPATIDSTTTTVGTKKVVADGVFAEKTFNFSIVGINGTKNPVDASATHATITSGTASATQAGEYEINFGTLYFDEPGTYSYRIDETLPGDGWTVDPQNSVITIKVEANGTNPNELVATVETAPTVTNTYASSGTLDTSTTAILTKTVTSTTSFPSMTFDFALTAGTATYADGTTGTSPVDRTTSSATFSAAGTQIIDFGTIAFTKAGTYTYALQETNAAADGWTFDTTVKTVTITVIDNGDGTLTATVETPATITNVANNLSIEKVETAHDSVANTSTWTITVTNNGSTSADNVIVTENPTNLSYLSTIGLNGASEQANDKGVVYTIPTINAGDSFSIAGINFAVDDPTNGYANGASIPTPESYELDKERVTDATGTTPASGTVNAGDTVYYRVSLTNTGTTAIDAGTSVTDNFSGLTYTGNDPAVIASSSSEVIWTAPAIDPGTTVSVVLPFTVNSGYSEVRNTATVPGKTVTVKDPVLSYTLDKTLTNSADVDKAGDDAIYAIDVTNTSAGDGTNVRIDDKLTNLTLDEYSAEDTTTSTKVDVNYVNGQFVLASLPKGDMVRITVHATVNRFPITNRASKPTSEQSYVLNKQRCDAEGNAISSDTVTKPGDIIYYLVTITNTTDGELAPVDVTDTPGDGLTLAAAMTADGTVALGGNAITWTTPTLAKDATVSMVVTATVDADVTGSVTNTAKTPDQVVTVTVPITPTQDVVVDKTLVKTEIVGDVTYQYFNLTVTNNGPSVAKNVTAVEDPSNMTFTGDFEDNDATDASYDASTKTFGFGTLAAKQSMTLYNLKFVVTDTSGSTTNNVTVPNPSATTSYDLLKARVTDATGTTAVTGAVQAGDTVYYKVTIKNTGTTTIPAGTVVTDTFSGLTFQGDTTGTSVNGVSYDKATQAITWTAPEVAAGSEASVVLAFKVDGTLDIITNKATTGPKTVVVTDPVNTVDVVKMLKSYDQAAGIAVYDLTVTAVGKGTTSGVVIDENPVNLEYQSFDAQSGVSYANGKFTIASLAVDSPVTISNVTFKVTGTPFANGVKVETPDDDLHLTKTRVTDTTGTVAAVGSVAVGDTVYYKLTLTNNGSVETPAGHVVTDTPDSCLTYTGTAAGVTADANGTLTWTTQSAIETNQSVSVVIAFRVTTDAAKDGQVSNVATRPGETVIVTDPVPTITVRKSITNPADVNKAGDTATYAVTVTNSGKADAKQVEVNDTLTGSTMTSFSAADERLNSVGCTYASGQFTIAAIPAGETVTITVNAKIDAFPATNVAEDANPSDGKSYTTTKELCDSQGNVLPANSFVTPGAAVYYKLTLTNTGDSALDPVILTDEPQSANLTNGAKADGLVSDGTVAAANNVITWTTPTLEKGATATAYVSFTVAADATSSVDNALTSPHGTIVVTDPVTTPVTDDLLVAKTVTGNAPAATYGFTLTPADATNPMPATATATVAATAGPQAGLSAEFGTIAFKEAGTYVYTVTEDKGTAGGVTYDDSVYTITYVVTANADGSLSLAKTIAKDAATAADVTFTNSYATTPVTDSDTALGSIPVTKTVKTGSSTDTIPAENYTFTLVAKDGAPSPATVTTSVDGTGLTTDGAIATSTFGSITYTTPGTYYYQVVETAGTTEGMTYDTTIHDVEVTITDNGDGTLGYARSISVAGTGTASDTAAFTNTYTMPSVTPYTYDLTATKVLAGQTAPSDSTFNFAVAGTTTAASGIVPMPENAAAGTISHDGAGSIDFGNITFAEAGTYTYTVTETAGISANWTYDASTYVVTITVAEGANHILTASAPVITKDGAAAEAVTFTNAFAYTPTTTDTVPGALEVNKILSVDSDAPTAANSFSFDLTGLATTAASGVVPMPGDTTAPTVTTTIDGVSTPGATYEGAFDAITFTEPGDYYYTVVEDNAASTANWTYDTSSYVLKFTVTSDDDGTLSVAAPTILESGKTAVGSLTFTNKFTATKITPVDWTPSVAKITEGAPSDSNATFNFQIIAANDAASEFMPATTTASVVNAGTATFDTVSYDKVGTYVYDISETAGTAGGWTYDKTVYRVTVAVTEDEATGIMSKAVEVEKIADAAGATVSEAVASTLTFTNTFAYLPVTDTGIAVAKTLAATSDAPATAGAFTYQLTGVMTSAKSGVVPMPADITSDVASATVSGVSALGATYDGTFGTITYTEPGTYLYRVIEVNDAIANWTYDGTAYLYKVTVGSHDAQLAIDGVEITNAATGAAADALSFTNSYKTPYVGTAHVTLTKSLDDAAKIYAAGDTAGYTITVTNTGDADADNVIVTDIADNLTYVSSTGATRTGSGWTIDKVAASSSVTIKATYTVDATPFSNYAGTTPEGGNDYTLAKTRVTDATGTTKATGAVEVGQTVYYLITLTPTEGSTVPAGTVVTDTYDNGLTFDAAQSSGSVVAGSGNTLTWTFGSDATAATSVVVAFTVNENATGNVVNKASTPTKTVITVTPVAQLDVTKKLVSYDADSKTAVFEITVTNTGTDTLTNASFAENPTNLTFKSFDAQDGVSYSNGTFTIASLAAGKSVTITGVILSVNATPFENQVVAPQPGPQKADIAKARVDANGNAATDEVKAGDTVYYKLTLTNTGTTTIPVGYAVTDTPSANLSYNGGAASVTKNPDGTLAWKTTEALQPGQSTSVIVSFAVSADATSQIDNAVHIPGKTVVVVTPLTPTKGDLVVTKAVDKSVVNAGDTLTYTLTVKNTGNGDLSGVWIKDYVPANTTFAFIDESGTHGSTAAGKEFVNWYIAKLAAGETKTLTFTVVVNDVPAGMAITNTALVDTNKTSTEANNPENDPSSTTNTVTSKVLGTTAPTNPSKTGTGLTDTGDPTMLSNLFVVLVVGSAAMLARWGLRRRNR